MTTHTGVTSDRATVERPDGEYAFVAGLYVAALLAPALVLLLASVRSDAAALYVGFLLAVTGVTAVASWIVSRIPGLAIRLGRRDAVWLLVVLPFGWFAGAFGADALHVDLPGVAVPLAVVGTAGGMLLGLMLVAMSRTRHAASVLSRTTESASWEARWPRRWRRVAGAVSAIGFAAGAVGAVAALGFGVERGWQLYYLLFVGAVVMNVLNPRTFRVTDAGLVVEHPVGRQFRPWSAFAGYELTDDALVIRSAARWRPDHRSDRADVEDVDAVVAALDGHLPRRGPTRRRGEFGT